MTAPVNKGSGAAQKPSIDALSLRDQLLRAARGSVLLRIVALSAAMATSVVLARALGPAAYGTYAYVFAIVTLLALPSQVGIPALLIRETAKAQAQEAWPRLKGLWAWATRTILLTSLVLAVAAAVAVVVRGDHIDSDLRWTLVAGMVLVPLIALGNARGAALNGLRLIVRGQLPESIIRPLLLICFVGLAWMAGGQMSAPVAMAWHALAAAIAFAVGGAILWRARPVGLAAVTADTSYSPDWWRAALPLALISGLQVAGSQSGIILLGVFRPDAEVGEYKVATSAAALALFGLQTASLVIAPHIARLHTLGERSKLQRLASVGALAGVVMTLPVFLVFAIAGKWLIGLLYGSAYIGAYAPLLILAAGQMVNAFFGLNAGLMSMTGHERDAARWLTISAGSAILFSLILIPSLGMIGAALAYVFSMTVWNVAFWIIVSRKVGVDSSLRAAFAPGFVRALRRG
jgi:O-antigen/teichoic acid export membrane protein